MDCYKPVFTENELKKECSRASKIYDTPLTQTKEVIKRIQKKTSKKLQVISIEDWQDMPENSKYTRIAFDYAQRKLRESRKRKEK